MRVLVTGATGFVGANVTRALLAEGFEVRALVRAESNRMALEGLEVETVTGDLRDEDSLNGAVRGCDAVFHCAAYYDFWARNVRVFYDTNVKGTRNVLRASQRAGVRRVVYTSSVATVGTLPDGRPSDESVLPSPGDLTGHYKKSKYLAEKEALKFAREGLDVVIVNPTAPIGPWDVKPTPTGRIVLDFLNGRMPAYPGTGLNVVDAEDCARGHVLALRRGRAGERYILGGHNVWMDRLLATLAEVAGRRPPRLRLPTGVLLALAYLDTLVEGVLLRRRPLMPLEGIREIRRPRFVDSSRAVRELGLARTPLRETLGKAVRWFTDHGYVRRQSR